MTELFINNTRCALPEDFSIDLLDENPFFTRSGQYTYNITLSLLPPTNARLYGHINRVNASSMATGRSACIIANNRIVISGEEIILSVSESEVQIQIVAAESQINLLLSSDRSIRSFDYGTIPTEETRWGPIYTITDPDYENIDRPWCRGLIYSSVIGSTYSNDLGLAYDRSLGKINCSDDTILGKNYGQTIFFHPFLRHIVHTVIEELGFTIDTSVFSTAPLAFIAIINTISTHNISKMLPDWTVAEFFEEIEKLFNIVFTVDPLTGHISISFRKDFYNSAAPVHIPDALDEFTCDVTDDNIPDYALANYGYDLTDESDYYYFQRLSSVITLTSPRIEVDTFADLLALIAAAADPSTLKRNLYRVAASDSLYIVSNNDGLSASYFPKRVNILHNVQNNPDSDELDITFRIVPAPMRDCDYPVWKVDDDDICMNFRCQAPETDAAYDMDAWTDNDEDPVAIGDIEAYVGNDVSDSAGQSQMKIAIYCGTQMIYPQGEEQLLPVPPVIQEGPRKLLAPVFCVDSLREFSRVAEIPLINRQNGIFPALEFNLRLDHPQGMGQFYQSSIAADTSKTYTFRFPLRNGLDPRKPFVIRNRRFLCRQLKYVINPHGRDVIVEGQFHPVI
jgi:hypothetical protein